MRMRFILVLGVLCLVIAARAQGQPAYQLAEGRLKDLRCKVRLLPLHGDSSRVALIQVSNRGKVAAEPLEFELKISVRRRGSPTAIKIRRMPLPDHGRAGNAVAPGRRVTYRLPLTVTKKPAKVSVVVTRASFFKGKPGKVAPARIVERTVRNVQDSMGRPRRQAVHTIKNEIAQPVDLILLAHYAEKGRRFLRLLRLKPGETITWDGDEAPAGSRLAGYQHFVEGYIRKLEIVDWSVIVDSGSGLAAELSKTAVASLAAWPRTATVSGRCRWRAEGREGSGPLTGQGSFQLEPGGPASISSDTSMDSLTQSAVTRVLQDAFVFLQPMAPRGKTDLLSNAERKIVRLSDPLFRLFDSDARLVEIERGRLVGARMGPAGTMHATWSLEARGKRFLPKRVQIHNGTGPLGQKVWAVILYEWTKQAGRIVPRTCTHDLPRAGIGSRERIEVTFESMTWSDKDVVRRPSRPEGKPVTTEIPVVMTPEIPELRKAWDAHARHSRTPVDLVGRWSVVAPRTGANWESLEKVGGTIAFTGYTGWPGENKRLVYESARIETEARIGDSARDRISNLLQARFTIWTRLDPAALPPYSEAFAGATLTPVPGENGTWQVRGVPMKRVRIKKGRIHSMALVDGTLRTFEWRKVGARWLPSSVRDVNAPDHDSLLAVTWSVLPSGRMFPRAIQIKDWFHDGWGPETLQFESIRKR